MPSRRTHYFIQQFLVVQFSNSSTAQGYAHNFLKLQNTPSSIWSARAIIFLQQTHLMSLVFLLLYDLYLKKDTHTKNDKKETEKTRRDDRFCFFASFRAFSQSSFCGIAFTSIYKPSQASDDTVKNAKRLSVMDGN